MTPFKISRDEEEGIDQEEFYSICRRFGGEQKRVVK